MASITCHFTENCTPLQIFNSRCKTTLLKYASSWLPLRTNIIFEKIPVLDMLKHKLRETVQSLKTRVEIQKCNFKSTSLNL